METRSFKTIFQIMKKAKAYPGLICKQNNVTYSANSGIAIPSGLLRNGSCSLKKEKEQKLYSVKALSSSVRCLRRNKLQCLFLSASVAVPSVLRACNIFMFPKENERFFYY